MIAHGLNAFGGLVSFGLNPRLVEEFLDTTNLILYGTIRSEPDFSGQLRQWASLAGSLADAVRLGALTATDLDLAATIRTGTPLSGLISAVAGVFSQLDANPDTLSATNSLTNLQSTLQGDKPTSTLGEAPIKGRIR
jgi:hypothetical protein